MVIIVVFIVGMIYDVVGRRITMTVALLMSGLSLLFLPHTSPSKSMFIVVNVCSSIGSNILTASPLMLDYASKEE